MNRSELQRECVRLINQSPDLLPDQCAVLDESGDMVDDGSHPNLSAFITQKHFFPCTNKEMSDFIASESPEDMPILAWLMAHIDKRLTPMGHKISQCQIDKRPGSPTHGQRCVVINHNLVGLPAVTVTGGTTREDAYKAVDWSAICDAADNPGQAPERKPKKHSAEVKIRKVKLDIDPATLQDHRTVVRQELANLQRVRECLNSRWLEREQEIAIMLTSAVAGRHAFFRGPPGTGKTEMLQDFATMVGGSVFDTVLGMNTLRDEIEGPIDVPYLQSTGKQRRNRAGTITDCDFAVLDEVWKANSGLLNQLLRIMSQRDYFEEGRVHKAKTRCVFGASNEGPQGGMLEALHSRFMLRGEVGYVSNPDNRRLLLGFDEWDRQEIPTSLRGCLSLGDLDKIRTQALKLPTCPRFEGKWEKAITKLRDCRVTRKKTGIVIDDRRAKGLMEIARVWAFLQGDDAVMEPMVLILQFTAWNGLKEKVQVEECIREVLSDLSIRTASHRGEEVKSYVASMMAYPGGPPEDWKEAFHLHPDNGDDLRLPWIDHVNNVAFGAPAYHMQKHIRQADIRAITCLDIQRRAWAESAKA